MLISLDGIQALILCTHERYHIKHRLTAGIQELVIFHRLNRIVKLEELGRPYWRFLQGQLCKQ